RSPSILLYLLTRLYRRHTLVVPLPTRRSSVLQRLVRLDAVAARAVAEVRRDDQQPARALLYTLEALLPAGDDLPRAEDEPERLRSEEHTSELQSRENAVCRRLLEKKI